MKWLLHEREEALVAHELVRTRMANWKQLKFIPFEKGQKMWLDTRNFKTGHHKKITPKREGPFEIEEVLGPVTYRLKLPESWKIHNVFPATLLCPYIENKIHGNNYPQPLAKLLEGKEVYEVKTILKHRKRWRGYQYYIKWKGYPVTEATWENKSAFSNDREMVEQYKLWHQLWHHHPWNNMPSIRLFQSMPNLKVKGSRIRLNERTHEHRVRQLEKELEGMFLEYKYMNNPIKAHRPLSIITIDKILWNCLTDD